MTIIWCMLPEIQSVMDRIFCHFGPFFCLFTSLKTWKKEKKPGDIVILYKCTKNHDHMLYYSWDMVHDGCNCYFLFWATFSPNLPEKWKLKKKWNTCLEISSFHTSVPKIMIICYTGPVIWHVMDVTVIFHFGLFFFLHFYLLPPPASLTAQKIKISKKWKKQLRYHHFTHVY